MKLYFATAQNAPAVVVSGGNREQATRIAGDYFRDLKGAGAQVASIIRIDTPDNARVIATANQP